MPEKVIFRPILPKNLKYFDDLANELIGELGAAMAGPVARSLVQAEENYIDNWEHKPKIISQYTHMKTQLKLVVKPSGKNKRYWVFVSFGTKLHTITPSKSEFLRVRQGYIPRTTPGGVYGGPGSYDGGVFYTQGVEQKIEPRHFEEHIVDKLGDTIVLQLGIAFERALRRFR